MSDELIARGKALAEAGKYAPKTAKAEKRTAQRRAQPRTRPPAIDGSGGAKGETTPSLTAREILRDAGMISAAELDRMTFPPLDWHVPGLVPEGFGLLVAPPKAGKSWLVAGVGLACALGGMAFGRIDVPARPVLYLALEDGRRPDYRSATGH